MQSQTNIVRIRREKVNVKLTKCCLCISDPSSGEGISMVNVEVRNVVRNSINEACVAVWTVSCAVLIRLGPSSRTVLATNSISKDSRLNSD